MKDLQRGNSAFTLIELLVVISIIVLLVAILLPVLARAREAAMQIQCLSNVRQIAFAGHTYAHDNNDSFPYHNWHTDLNPKTLAGNKDYDEHGYRRGGITRYLFSEYEITKPTVLTCPTVHNVYKSNTAYFTNYSINRWATWSSGDYQTVNSVRRPSQMSWFSCGWRIVHPADPTRNWFAVHMRWIDQDYFAGQGWLHGDGISVAYIDGHAQQTGRSFIEATASDTHVFWNSDAD